MSKAVHWFWGSQIMEEKIEDKVFKLSELKKDVLHTVARVSVGIKGKFGKVLSTKTMMKLEHVAESKKKKNEIRGTCDNMISRVSYIIFLSKIFFMVKLN